MPNRAGLDLLAGVSRNHVVTDVALRVEVPREALEQAGDYLRERQRRVFATNGFGQWAPNDPATVKIKGSSQPLHGETHELLQSFTDENAKHAHHVYGRDSVTVASTHKGGFMASKGYHSRSVRDPAPDLSRAELADLTNIIGKFVVTQARR